VRSLSANSNKDLKEKHQMQLAHTKTTQLQQTYSDISPHNIQPILVLWGHLQPEAHLGH
jgi:hypothetical protein